MKIFKNFLLYGLILLGLCVLAVLICGLSMILFNAEILGYKYVNYKDVVTKEYTEVSTYSALEINTGRMAVKVYPTDTTKIIIKYSEGMYGFVKSKDSKLEYSNTSKNDMTFIDSSNVYNTFIVTMDEPTGLYISSDSVMNVYVPSNITIVSVNNTSGAVSFEGTQEKTLELNKLYVSKNKGSVDIKKTTAGVINIENESGDTAISSSTAMNSNVAFESNSGKMTIGCNLNGNLAVTSNSSKIGPYVFGKNVSGKVDVSAVCGKLDLDEIGTESAPTGLFVQANNYSINVETVYGKAIIGKKTTASQSVGVNIGKLISQNLGVSNTSSITTGDGDITIGQIDCPINIDTSHGNVSLKDVRQIIQGNISIGVGNSANVNVVYNATVQAPAGSKFIATIKSGNLTVKNITVLTNISANSDKSGNIDLEFLDVKGSLSSTADTNVIESKNHNLTLKINGQKKYRLAVYKPTGAVYTNGLGTETTIASTETGYYKEYTGGDSPATFKKLIMVNRDSAGSDGDIEIVSSNGSVNILGKVY